MAESRGKVDILYDFDSFERIHGVPVISDELNAVIEELVFQMRDKPAIDDITFKHVDYGDDATIYLRRDSKGFLVTLETKYFSIKAD